MTIGTWVVLLIVVVIIAVLLAVLLLRLRRPRLVDRGRSPLAFRRRRIEAIKQAVADDIALIQESDGTLGPDAATGRETS